MKLSVVIVSYNVKYYLAQCLRSVEKAIGVLECGQQGDASGDTAEIIVVDNHSQDGTVEYLEQCFPASRYPNLHVVACTHNNGFARANNLAIRKSESDLVLLLNPDTIIGEHVLKDAVSFMRSHPDAGALGVRMLGANGKPAPESRRGLPSPMVAFYKMMGLCSRFPRHRSFGHYYMGYLPWDEPAPIEVVSGAFCMIRREALQKVGLLDESFFMYGEDIDLSYRIVLGGYKNLYVPERILHYKGESTKHGDLRYIRAFYGAMLIFYKKYYPGSGWLMRILIRLAVLLKACWATISAPLRKKAKAVKHRRLLILCREDHFEEVKAVCLKAMPDLEFVNLWDLDVERVMDAICRKNQMKGFTDYAFCFPDARYEQMLLFMDKLVNKKAVYHIYTKKSGRLV